MNIPWKNTLIIFGLFFTVNLSIFIFSDSTCRIVGFDCYHQANYWGQEAAQSLLEHGKLVHLDAPDKVLVGWPPLFAILEVGTRIIGPPNNVTFLIILNVMIVLVIGLVVRVLVAKIDRRFGNVAMSLILFNPLTLTLAHLPREETLQTLLLTLAFVCVLSFPRRPSLWIGAAAGLSLGLSTLTRPVTQFLIPLLPIALVWISLLSRPTVGVLRAALIGATGAGIGFLVVLPWLLHVNEHDHRFAMTSRAEEHLYLLDNLRFLTADRPGFVVQEAKRKFINYEEKLLSRRIPGWQILSRQEQDVHKLAFIKEYFFSGAISVGTFAQALVMSWARFLLSSGESWIRILFNVPVGSALGPVDFMVSYVPMVFAIVSRFLGLLGVVELFRRRELALLTTCLGLILYHLAVHLVYGQSRYRAPLEPQFAILAGFGVAMLWSHFGKTRSATPELPMTGAPIEPPPS